eukprot:CAMPEP_0174732234 /NCGR_PEP_ID=MMETSP1094-20130205/59028_1 /TAXON_ID=156173 /ORGANISM="Chrysochromulina brevifilum, Strain UTEX LB 985" /LENGTH=36 /DNA_ID= /DNA_START= /DNA_END= /DNA_ORIENTATION=
MTMALLYDAAEWKRTSMTDVRQFYQQLVPSMRCAKG